MEAIEVDSQTFEEIEGFEDLEEVEEEAFYNDVDHMSKKRKEKKAARKAKRKAGKGFFGKVGKVMKKIGAFAGDLTIFAPLAPLRPMMRKMLAKKGKDPGKKTHTGELAKIFYNEVVAKHGNYEEIHCDFDLEPDNIVEAAASGIIKGILEFIKGLKKKKSGGEKLSKVEAEIVSGTEKVEKQIKQGAKDEAATQVGKRILFDKKTQIIIAVVIIAIIGVVWYLRRNN